MVDSHCHLAPPFDLGWTRLKFVSQYLYGVTWMFFRLCNSLQPSTGTQNYRLVTVKSFQSHSLRLLFRFQCCGQALPSVIPPSKRDVERTTHSKCARPQCSRRSVPTTVVAAQTASQCARLWKSGTTIDGWLVRGITPTA